MAIEEGAKCETILYRPLQMTKQIVVSLLRIARLLSRENVAESVMNLQKYYETLNVHKSAPLKINHL